MEETLGITRVSLLAEHGAWRCERGLIAEKVTSSYEMFWVVQGKASCKTGPNAFTVSQGDVVLLRPGQEVRWSFSKSLQSFLYVISFDVCGLPESWQKVNGWPLKRTMPDNDVIRPLFEFVIKHAECTGEKASPAVALAVQTMMIAFVSGPLDRPQAPVNGYPVIVTRVLKCIGDLIACRPGYAVTLEDMAEAAGSSASQVCRLFREYVGCSPLELVYQLRITRSLIGLGAGERVESLAYKFGFSSPSHYTRRFKALLGMSPQKMQRAMAQGYKPQMPDLPLMKTE